MFFEITRQWAPLVPETAGCCYYQIRPLDATKATLYDQNVPICSIIWRHLHSGVLTGASHFHWISWVFNNRTSNLSVLFPLESTCTLTHLLSHGGVSGALPSRVIIHPWPALIPLPFSTGLGNRLPQLSPAQPASLMGQRGCQGTETHPDFSRSFSPLHWFNLYLFPSPLLPCCGSLWNRPRVCLRRKLELLIQLSPWFLKVLFIFEKL